MRLLDLAPHATLPPRDGADKRAWYLYNELIAAELEGTFIARTVVVHDQRAPALYPTSRCWRDRKEIAALVAAATGSDYWRLKMLRPGVRQAVAQAIDRAHNLVLVNFLYALPLLSAVPKPYQLVVDTHNYDPASFSALSHGALNPLLRLLCRRAVRLSEQALRDLPSGTVLAHVSSRDAARVPPPSA